MNCDFSGWATRNDLLCSDGRIIRHNAFKDNDGIKVPLVWNHQHNDPRNVLGHALLENRDDGVYAYGFFNDTESGEIGKALVKHGDIEALSIYANQLKQNGPDVVHGCICEVSLVHKGANPGAFIDTMLAHSDDSDEEAIIYTGMPLTLSHSEESANEKEDEKVAEEKKEEQKKEGGETVEDVINTMNEKQKNVMYALIGQALEEGCSDDNDEEDSKEEDKEMKHNVFENDKQNESNVLSHSAQAEILNLARSSSVGSLRDAMQIYAEENDLSHAAISGFEQTGTPYNVTTMFPDYVEAHPGRTPELITNDMGWVDAIMSKTQKVPHGRVRTSHVDIRNIDSLKAKGYKKGDKKNITGNYNLVRRTTDPQTVYVTSELHRDDVIDIEDFDYVQFQYNIDQMNLKETLAVATMLGDERNDSDPEKIFAEHIRPVWTDDELYTIHKDIDTDETAKELQGSNTNAYFGEGFILAESIITALRKARKDFRGTGKPDMYLTSDALSTMILARDRNGRRIYNNESELATAMGVGNIYEVVQFENRARKDSTGTYHELLAIVVNMADYAYGASKGGDITHFTDFDIKFNQLQSLLETRKSGQLTRIKSAIVLERPISTNEAEETE